MANDLELATVDDMVDELKRRGKLAAIVTCKRHRKTKEAFAGCDATSDDPKRLKRLADALETAAEKMRRPSQGLADKER